MINVIQQTAKTNKKKGNSQGSHTADRWRKEENNNRKISQITRMQKTYDLPVIKWTRWKPDNLGKIMQLWEQKTVSVELWMHPGASSYLLFMQIIRLSKLIISRLRLISFLYFVDHAAHRTCYRFNCQLVIYTNCDGIGLSIPQSLKKLLDRLESLKEFYFISGLYIVFVQYSSYFWDGGCLHIRRKFLLPKYVSGSLHWAPPPPPLKGHLNYDYPANSKISPDEQKYSYISFGHI